MLALAFAVAALLRALAARLALWRRAAPPLPDPLPAAPATTVLLPVRDEERDVAGCVATLLAQTARPRVRVIDDGSRDATAAIVGRLAVGEPRLELIRIHELTPGWLGKTHALARGLEGVADEWVLLTDADTRHRPDLLARAHAAAALHGLDLLSIAGRQQAAGLGEGLLTALVFALLDFWLGDWRAAARGEGGPVANGQFILLRRSALAAAGGLQAIRGEALDDVALARLLRGAGSRTGFVRDLDALTIRMYRGLGATWRGWRRNLGALGAGAPGVFALALLLAVAPAAVLVATLALGHGPAALVLWAGGAAASALARHGSRHPAWHGLAFPFDALAFAALLAAAFAARRRRQLWKGRAVRI